MIAVSADGFESWRTLARKLLAQARFTERTPLDRLCALAF